MVGRTVRTVHAVPCPRRAVLARARKAAGAHAPLRRPAVTGIQAQQPEAAPARHASLQARAVEPRPARTRRPPRCRIRPKVVASWRVRGCRITVDGWPATVASEIRTGGGTPQVRLDFDDYRTWTPRDQAQVPDWWDLEDLTRPQHARAA